MILYLVRHGNAADATPGEDDSQRRLTRQGTLRTALVAKGLTKLGINFDRIISSPFLRARQTAEIIGRVTEHKDDILFDVRLTPLSRFRDADVLVKENADVEHLLLAGHQPSIGEFISNICATAPIKIEIKEGSVTAIELLGYRPHIVGKLLWILPPILFETLGS